MICVLHVHTALFSLQMLHQKLFLLFRPPFPRVPATVLRLWATSSSLLYLRHEYPSTSANISINRITFTYCRSAYYWLFIPVILSLHNSSSFATLITSPQSTRSENSIELFLLSQQVQYLSVVNILWSLLSYFTGSQMSPFFKSTSRFDKRYHPMRYPDYPNVSRTSKSGLFSRHYTTF